MYCNSYKKEYVEISSDAILNNAVTLYTINNLQDVEISSGMWNIFPV
jgi:hypothetical protein